MIYLKIGVDNSEDILRLSYLATVFHYSVFSASIHPSVVQQNYFKIEVKVIFDILLLSWLVNIVDRLLLNLISIYVKQVDQHPRYSLLSVKNYGSLERVLLKNRLSTDSTMNAGHRWSPSNNWSRSVLDKMLGNQLAAVEKIVSPKPSSTIKNEWISGRCRDDDMIVVEMIKVVRKLLVTK